VYYKMQVTKKGTEVSPFDFDELLICYFLNKNKGNVFFYMCRYACLGGKTPLWKNSVFFFETNISETMIEKFFKLKLNNFKSTLQQWQKILIFLIFQNTPTTKYSFYNFETSLLPNERLFFYESKYIWLLYFEKSFSGINYKTLCKYTIRIRPTECIALDSLRNTFCFSVIEDN